MCQKSLVASAVTIVLLVAGMATGQETTDFVIAPGNRVFSVPVVKIDESVKPGDLVDLIGQEKDNPDSNAHRLHGYKLVGVTSSKSRGGSGGVKKAMLLATIKQVETLEMAIDHCRLSVVPMKRPADDAKKTSPRSKDPNASSNKDTKVQKQRQPKVTELVDLYAGTQVAMADLDSVSIEVGEAKTIQLPNKVVSIEIGNPSIASVEPTAVDRIRITGKGAGETIVRLTDEHRKRVTVKLKVRIPVSPLEDAMSRVFPDVSIEVIPLQQAVVLKGRVKKEGDINQIVEVAEDYFPRVIPRLELDAPRTGGNGARMLSQTPVRPNRDDQALRERIATLERILVNKSTEGARNRKPEFKPAANSSSDVVRELRELKAIVKELIDVLKEKTPANRVKSKKDSASAASSSTFQVAVSNASIPADRTTAAFPGTNSFEARIANRLDEIRVDMARRWFQREVQLAPCQVEVKLNAKLGSGGYASYELKDAKPINLKMHLQASSLEKLDSAMHHEVAHLLLAQQFANRLPHWLEEGFCTLQEGEERRRQLEAFLIQSPKNIVPIERLLASTSDHDLDSALSSQLSRQAQYASLVAFLLDRDSESTLVAMMKAGDAASDWTQALLQTYKISSIEVLEAEWSQWRKQRSIKSS